MGDPLSDDPEPAMAIDFEVEPEFQEKLDWIDGFIREEIEPLDLYFRDTVSPVSYTHLTLPTNREV